MPSSGLPSSSPDSPVIHDLSTPEEIALRKRRRRLIVVGSLVAVSLALGLWLGRPALRAVKVWQARRSAAEAIRLLEAGEPNAAVTKLQDALTLRGNDPEVIRRAADFLTRVGHGKEAIAFWQEAEKNRPLNREEQRAYAADLLLTGNLPEAVRRQRLAWPEGSEGTPADWSLAMGIAVRSGDAATAATLAGRLLDGKAAGVTDRQRLEAASVLLGVNDPARREAGLAAMRSLADSGRTAESLDAVLTLTKLASQRILAARARQQAAPDVDTQELLSLADRIEKHPLAKTVQGLAAIQARIIAQPDRRAALIQSAVDRYGATANNDDLASLGAWLYAQGELQKLAAVLPLERAVGSRALYLQYLDLLGAQGRWEDIRHTIEGQKFSLDPMVEQMYLARCATQLHQPESAELHWTAALRAAGANPDKLLSLGHYAQSGGALPTAEAAFRAAVKAAPDLHSAHEALLGVLAAEGRTREARDAVHAMLAIWPQEAAVRNDDAYLSLLLGENLAAARDVASELVRQEPGSLPHRITLALAELRLGHASTALEGLQQIDPKLFASQPRFLAVYAAVLWAADHHPEAQKAVENLPLDRLLPEERALVEPIPR